MSAGQGAQAASGILELNADGPCLSAAALEERLLSGTKNPLEPSLRVRVQGRAPDDLSFSIWRAGELIAVRSFSASTGDCEDLLDALALAIALGLDAVEPPIAAPTAPRVASRATTLASKPGVQRRPVRLLTGALLMSGFGGALAGGASLGLAWTFEPPMTLLVGAAATWPTSSRLGTGSVVSQLSSAGFRLCYRAPRGSFAASACAGADAGAVFARGEGFVANAGGVGAWAAAGIGPTLSYETAGGLGLLASLDGLLSLARPHFDVQSRKRDTVDSTRPGAFVWRLGLSASYAIF